MPRSWELTLGPLLGRLALRLDRRRRRVAEENIRRCLPDLAPAAREKLLRENFEHYGVLFFELLHMFSPLPGHYRRYARRTATLEGIEHWRRAHEKGKGVLFASTALLTRRTEEWIRREPAQWLWAHRRFKGVARPDEVVDSRKCTPATATPAGMISTSS